MKIYLSAFRWIFAVFFLLVGTGSMAKAQQPSLEAASLPVSQLLAERTPQALVPDLLTTTGSTDLDRLPKRLRLKPQAKKAALFQLALSPAWMQSGIAFHEGMHAIPCLVIDICSIVKYKPFPGYLDSPTYGREFYYGYVDMEVDEGKTLTDRQNLAISGGPLAGDMMLFALGDVLLSRVVSKDSRAAPFLFAGTMIVPFVDFVHNAFQTDPVHDVVRIRNYVTWQKEPMLLTSLVLTGVGICRLTHHAKRIFFEKRQVSSE